MHTRCLLYDTQRASDGQQEAFCSLLSSYIRSHSIHMHRLRVIPYPSKRSNPLPTRFSRHTAPHHAILTPSMPYLLPHIASHSPLFLPSFLPYHRTVPLHTPLPVTIPRLS